MCANNRDAVAKPPQKITDNKCTKPVTNVAVGPALDNHSEDMATKYENNSVQAGIDASIVSQLKQHDDSENHSVPPVTDLSVVDDGEFSPCYSDEGENDEFNEYTTNKSKEKNHLILVHHILHIMIHQHP